MTSLIERPQGPSTGSGTQAPPADIDARAPRRRISPERISAAGTLVVIAALAVASLADLNISFAGLFDSWGNAQNFFARVGGLTFPPAEELLQLTVLTVGLVLTGTVLAAALSVPIACLAASNTTPNAVARAIARFIGVFTRALPDVVLAMVFVLMFSLGTLPGILAIGIHSIGMISKMFADAIEQIDEGPRLAIRAAGGTRMQEFFSGVLPQVLPSWVATVLHRNDINLRGSVVLGYVGVAGLGLEMSHAFKSLNYGLGLGIALVIFLLCVVMEVVSSAVRVAMLGEKDAGKGVFVRLFTALRSPRAAQGPGNNDGSLSLSKRRRFASVDAAMRRPWTAARVRNVSGGLVAIAVVIAGVAVSDIVWSDLLTFWVKIPEVAAQFWPPDFGNYGFPVIAGAMLDTVKIALAACLITLVLSLGIGSLAARNVAPNAGVRGGFRLLLVVIRGIPELILAIVLIVITGLGAQAGTIALAFGGIGLLGKLIADSFEEVPRGPERAMTAAGATRLQRYAAATLPQGSRALIGHTFYLLDTNIRAATLLGIVGGGGVGYYLLNAGQGSNYPLVTSIVLMILVTVLIVEGIAMWMRKVFR
ncbi:ABC transporter permease subunit [Microbacterium sp. KUDC0406]|uniref:PhnE/PtxC family ABC transporter permease n=1 Tax=Microbacterium sp. KUDC0406 TaxID=2909588 RepID=UPI001F26985B|nr:ABC transporter permease subunit [Microbacterium sp. KUDC0406]UJP10194.1 ABC transporter permease subunit [Microbacterium sp. KUDC0406]